MMAARLRSERGNVSLLVVIMLPALLIAAGLVLDGGRQLQVRRDTNAAAAAAARAATQMSEQEIHGAGLDSGLAAERATVSSRTRAWPGRLWSPAVGLGDGHGDGRPPHPPRLTFGLLDLDGHARRGSRSAVSQRKLGSVVAPLRCCSSSSGCRCCWWASSATPGRARPIGDA